MPYYKKMNARWKDWWLRALRGGNYQQGQRRLRSGSNKCCCFGVLADGMAPDTWVLSAPHGDNYEVGDERASLCLPKSLQAEANLDLNIVVHLENMNDFGFTFAEIADWIEKCL